MATAAAREGKLRKLGLWRRTLPHVSMSALAAMLKETAARGIPELHHNRQQLAEATALEMNEEGPYGKMLVEVDVVLKTGGIGQILTINPLALLHKAFAQGGSFTDLIIETLKHKPSKPEAPWQLILYADEVVPGNQLANQNNRKVWVMYFSFVELGHLVLQKEEAWLCNLVCRSTVVGSLSAGISQAFAVALKLFFGGLTCNLATGGMVLTHSDGSQHRLWCNLGMILQDGGAHKLVWHCKGDAGTKMCMLCRNLVSVKSKVVDEDGSQLLTCSVVFEEDLDFATDKDLRGTISRLAAAVGTMSKAQFELKQQACGFNHEPHSILSDQALLGIVFPASQFCHDWMHAMLVNGVFHTVTYLLLIGLGPDIYSTLQNYIGLWRFPANVANSSLKDLFAKKRKDSNNKAGTFKCSASEGLGVYPILAFFVQAVVLPAGLCSKECRAFLALADVLDLLQAVPRSLTTPAQLRAAIAGFLRASMDAGWEEHMQPKFHWLIHLPKHLARFGILPTCWVHERKHKVVKRYANDIKNSRVYERSVLGEVCCHNLSFLSQPGVFDLTVGLVNPRAANAKLTGFLGAELGYLVPAHQCFTASVARILPTGTCSRKDVVLIRSVDGSSFDAGEVWLHADAKGRPLTLVSVWQFVGYDKAKGSAEWLKLSNPTLVETADIISAVVHTECKAGVARILLPLQCRV
jgi:hypothetical protein